MVEIGPEVFIVGQTVTSQIRECERRLRGGRCECVQSAGCFIAPGQSGVDLERFPLHFQWQHFVAGGDGKLIQAAS